jgi:hypothetical protein
MRREVVNDTPRRRRLSPLAAPDESRFTTAEIKRLFKLYPQIEAVVAAAGFTLYNDEGLPYLGTETAWLTVQRTDDQVFTAEDHARWEAVLLQIDTLVIEAGFTLDTEPAEVS